MFNPEDLLFDEEQFIRENLSFLLDCDEEFSESSDSASLHFTSYEESNSIYGISPITSRVKETWSTTGTGSIMTPKIKPSTSSSLYFTRDWISPWNKMTFLKERCPSNLSIEDVYFGQNVTRNTTDVISDRNKKYIETDLYKLWSDSYPSVPQRTYFLKPQPFSIPVVTDMRKHFDNLYCAYTNTPYRMWPYGNVAMHSPTSVISKMTGLPLEFCNPCLAPNPVCNLGKSDSNAFNLEMNNYGTNGIPASSTAIFPAEEALNIYFTSESNPAPCKLISKPDLGSLKSDSSFKENFPTCRTSTPICQLTENEPIDTDVVEDRSEVANTKEEAGPSHSKPRKEPPCPKPITFEDFLKTVNIDKVTPKTTASTVTQSGRSKHQEFCKFCYKNGELSYVYMSHIMKSLDGTILCPILRKYVCDICGATGDKAHTRKYCPCNTEQNKKRLPFRRLTNGVLTSSHNHK